MGKRAKKRKRARLAWNDTPTLICWSLLLFGVAVATYYSTLGHGFVFDDATLIQQNGDLLSLDLWKLAGPQGYRPVRSLTYALNFWLGGLDPFGFHLFNVLLHALNGVIAFWFLYQLAGRIWLAFPTSLLFILHPVQTASVAYISGRKDLLATFFLMLGLMAYIHFRNGNRYRWLGLSLLAFILGCLSKEVALVFPALVLLVEAVHACRKREAPGLFHLIRERWRILAGLGAASLLLLIYSIYWATASRMEGFWGGSVWTNYGTSLKLFVHYIRLIVIPYPLLADYTGQVLTLSEGFLEPATLLSGLVVVGFLIFNIWAWRRDPLLGGGLSWFVIGVLPVLQIVPFHELAADHFLYLPSLGFCLVAGLLFERILQAPDFRVLGIAVLVGLLGIYTWRTVVRNGDWKSDESLWQATYRDAPNSFRANCNMGIFAYNRGDFDQALRLTERCRELKPEDALPYANLGATKRQMGLLALQRNAPDEAEALDREALTYLKRAIEHNPQDIWSMSNAGDALKDIALVQESRGESEAARASREKSLEYFSMALAQGSNNPNFSRLFFKKGAVLVDAGEYREAVPYLERAARELPRDAQAQNVLGFTYYMLGEWEEAAKSLQAAVNLQPTEDGIAYLAGAYRSLGQLDKAQKTLEDALRLFPNSAGIHYNLGILHESKRDFGVAKQYFLRALELAPEGPLAQQLRQRLSLN